MACYSPLHVFQGDLNEENKRPILFKAKPGEFHRLQLPCGKCIGCRLNYSKGWAIRCMHEAACHEENSAVTLTFDSKHVPPDGNLDVRHLQLFMKRLRKSLGRARFFFAGEYGGEFGRPHYHGLLFGVDFPDKYFWKKTSAESLLYRSPSLEKLWPFGYSSIGDVSFQTASYIARYCTKKATEVATSETFRDEDDGKRYVVDKVSGVLKRAEFTVMSRRPGIGSFWFDRYKSDVYPSDEVVHRGTRMRPPRYYDNLLDKSDPDLLEYLKSLRAQRVVGEDNTQARLDVKQEVALANMKIYSRNLEV